MFKLKYLSLIVITGILFSCTDENIESKNPVSKNGSASDKASWGFYSHLNIYAIKKNQTGTGSAEVHIINGADSYDTYLYQTGTALQEVGDSFDFLVEDYNHDGVKDVIAFSKSNTGTRSTEVHILNGADGFQSFLLHTGTALEETDGTYDFGLGDYNFDGIWDVYVIKKSRTGSNSTEVHILNGSDNYQSFLLHTATNLHETNDNWDFVLGDVDYDGRNDVIGIQKVTGTGSVRITAISGYNFSWFAGYYYSPTSLGEDSSLEFDTGDANGDGALDIVAFKKRGTNSHKTELSILDGNNSFYSLYLVNKPTAIQEVGNNIQFKIK